MDRKLIGVCCWFIVFLVGCGDNESGLRELELLQVFVGAQELALGGVSEGLPADRTISLMFSGPVDLSSARTSIQLLLDEQPIEADINALADGRTVVIYPRGILQPNTIYTVAISDRLRGLNGEGFKARQISFRTSLAALQIVSVEIADADVTHLNRATEVPLDLLMTIRFTAPVNIATLGEAAQLTGAGNASLLFKYSEANQTVLVTTATPLSDLNKYQFRLLSTLEGAQGESFAGFSQTLYTRASETPKFNVVSDDDLLTLVQRQTFKYFWDFAHPASGMARERSTSGDVVTTGGSGFAVMALIVAMERNFISRDQGLEHAARILTFLGSADRFHGAWPHWMNGNTGEVIPFSANDNGGDLVETSLMVQGLLTLRQYLDETIAREKSLIDRINALWESVDWQWYTRDGQNVMYWHWSPDKQWTMNHPVRGYNEALITYFLAASSPTHSVEGSVYHEGWAGNGSIRNGKSFYGISLPLGQDYGGPLFFAHYSFLGLDPRNLQDAYANYWTQNVSHSRIQQAYSVDNPKNFVGYSAFNWGLSASDNHQGYSAHSPTNDLGVITPTAALSSFPYTPEESMNALKFFYYTLGDRLWGPYGFYDAFNITEGWTADSYLAIDQGPIIIMIENYRTGLLWDLFMSSPEVTTGMNKLGFTR